MFEAVKPFSLNELRERFHCFSLCFMRFISLDPGGTTGVVIGHLYSRDNFIIDEALYFNYLDRFDSLHRIFQSQYDLVLYEDFRIFKRAANFLVGNILQSVRLIGMIEYCHYLYCPNAKLVSLQPSTKQGIKIKPEHQKIVSVSEHCKDAYLLIRYYSLLSKTFDKKSL